MVRTKQFFIHDVVILIFIAVLAFGCDSSYTTAKRMRAAKASQTEGEIVIGVVETSVVPNFFSEGVELAVEQINHEGGVLGRKIRTIGFDDRGDIETGQKIAREFAQNSNVIAVIGHQFSAVAIPAAITYSQSGILYISHGATNPLLTSFGGQYIFRNIPTDSEIGVQIAHLAKDRGYKAVAVFYQRDAELKTLADRFHERAVAGGLKIVTTRSYFSWQKDFRPILSELKDQYQFDSIFIAGLLPSTAYLIKQARDMGISVPIMGGDGLDSPSLLTIAGKASEGTIVSTLFNPKYKGKETQDFVGRFQTKYGFEPDSWSAQGYDAVSVLAHAIGEAGSAEPIVIGANLRFLRNWEGVTGSYSFNTTGDITGKSVYFKQVKDGKFTFLRSEIKEKASLFNYVKDYTLRLPVERAISTIDPGRISDEKGSIEIAEQLFLGLTDLDPNTYEAVPELATSWEASEDGRRYTFILRQDAKWTNGKPVTAHDIVWAVKRNISPETKSPGWYMLQIIKNAGAIRNGDIKNLSKLGVRALDDFILEFELEHPASYFPTIAGLWAYRPLPKDTIEAYKDRWTDPDKIQTNGSYKLALWEQGTGMVLIKNADYYDAENVLIPEIRYFIIPQFRLGRIMYENNELDIMGSGYLGLPLEEILFIKANQALSKEYSLQPEFCTYAYAFNVGREPVNQPLVRKAIAAAIDRHLIIDVLAGGDEQIATTFTCPPVFGAVDPKEGIGIPFNPLKARKWLAEAGYPDGEGFPKITLLYPASESHATFARAVKASLSHFLNIKVELKEKNKENFDKIVKKNDPPHMFLLNWCADYPDAHNFLDEVFRPSKPLYRFGWHNAEFEALMAMAEKEQNQKQRKDFYMHAERILCEEDVVVIPIFFDLAHSIVKSRIGGWYHMAIGGQHIRNWHLRE